LIKKTISLFVAVIFIFSTFSGVLAVEKSGNQSGSVVNGISNNLVFKKVEDNNFITSTVRDLEGNLVTEIKINKETNKVEINGVDLTKEEQEELNALSESASEQLSNSYFVSSFDLVGEKIDSSSIRLAKAPCKYKSLGTHYGSTWVPRIGVAAFAAYLSTITPAPWSGALAVASVAVGAISDLYYSINDAQCYSGKYIHNKRTVKFYKDKKRKKKIGPTSVSYQKRHR